MASKTLIFFGLCLALVVLISSEVSARDLAETNSMNSEETNGVADAKYDGGHDHGDHNGGGRGGYGGGGRGGGGRGGYGGGGRGGGGGHGGGGGGRGGGGRGRCYHGCCSRDYYGHGCRRCCSYAGEAVEIESHN